MGEVQWFQGPDFTTDLSVFDARFPSVHSKRVLVFRFPEANREKAVEIFRQALERLVRLIPILGGLVDNLPDEPGRQAGWKGVTRSKGIGLVVKDLSDQIDIEELEANDFQPVNIPNDVVAPVSKPKPGQPHEACMFQFNYARGGALVTVCISHVIADGGGDTEILRRLAGYCNAIQHDPESLEPLEQITPMVTDRSIFLRLQGGKTDPKDHPSYTLFDRAWKPARDESDNVEHDYVTKIYNITPASLQRLKEHATTTRISTHDALSALLWRSVLVNRVHAGVIKDVEGGVSTFHNTVSFRRYLGLGPEYIGNAVYSSSCSLKVTELLKPDSLPAAAAGVRSAISRVDKERVVGVAEIIRSTPHLGQFRWHGIKHILTTDYFATSLYHDETMYGSDWGSTFGHYVVRVRPTGLMGGAPGVHFVIPPRRENKGCEIQLVLERKGVEAMEQDEVFKQFFDRPR